MVAWLIGHQWQIVSVPAEWLPPTNPYAPPYPIVYDLSWIRAELDCREWVSLEEGMQRTVAWLVDHPPTPKTWGLAHYLSHDAFDCAAEDTAMAAVEKGG